MWEKANRIKGAVALAVFGTTTISMFMMAMIVVAANANKWELVDKWLMMLFTSLVCNAFLGFLYVKTNTKSANETA